MKCPCGWSSPCPLFRSQLLPDLTVPHCADCLAEKMVAAGLITAATEPDTTTLPTPQYYNVSWHEIFLRGHMTVLASSKGEAGDVARQVRKQVVFSRDPVSIQYGRLVVNTVPIVEYLDGSKGYPAVRIEWDLDGMEFDRGSEEAEPTRQ